RAALRLLLPRPSRAAGGVGEPAGHRDRPDPPPRAAAADGPEPQRAGPLPAGALRRRLRGNADPPARRPRAGRRRVGPGRDRGVRRDRAAAPRLRDPRRRARQPGGDPRMTTDPVLLEIVEGTLAAVEREVETAIGRTARSPMIRDAHDFRAGIHDRRLRKLTGRSYSALVHPVVRDYPLGTMRPGDVFFHNDVYRSEGGIGHLPDLCVTVPVFHDGDVVAFVQAFGHPDD